MKRYLLLAVLSLLLCACEQETAPQSQGFVLSSETDTDIVSPDDESAKDSSDAASRLEKVIAEAAGSDSADLVCPVFFGDFDSDGEEELFAVCGTGETVGSLWYADESRAYELASKQYDWDCFRTAKADGDNLILAEKLGDDGYGSTFCCRIDGGVPVEIDVFGGAELTQADGNDFTAMYEDCDFCTDGTGRTQKPYLLRYEDGIFMEYYALPVYDYQDGNCPLELEPEYEFLREYIDEITNDGGIVTSIYKRGRVYNINYKIVEEGYEYLAYRYYRNILADDGETEDITPNDNYGNYKAYVRNMLDLPLYGYEGGQPYGEDVILFG